MIAYRPAADHDRRFTLSGWSSSFRGSDAAGMIAAERWHTVMHVEIAAILARPEVTTIVAYETEATDHVADLYGFIAADPSASVVYYTYVAAPYRRMGIARGLFAAVGIDPRARFSYACKTVWCSTLDAKTPLAEWEPRHGRIQKQDFVPLERRRGRTRRQRAVPVTILRGK